MGNHDDEPLDVFSEAQWHVWLEWCPEDCWTSGWWLVDELGPSWTGNLFSLVMTCRCIFLFPFLVLETPPKPAKSQPTREGLLFRWRIWWPSGRPNLKISGSKSIPCGVINILKAPVETLVPQSFLFIVGSLMEPGMSFEVLSWSTNGAPPQSYWDVANHG